jgi:hypothetical protein
VSLRTESNRPRTCRGCGTRFEGQRWQRLCWRCWRERRDRDAQREAYQVGYLDGMLADAERTQRQTIPPQLVERLIRFAHPDRNMSRFEEANQLTRELLALRTELAA